MSFRIHTQSEPIPVSSVSVSDPLQNQIEQLQNQIKQAQVQTQMNQIKKLQDQLQSQLQELQNSSPSVQVPSIQVPSVQVPSVQVPSVQVPSTLSVPSSKLSLPQNEVFLVSFHSPRGSPCPSPRK